MTMTLLIAVPLLNVHASYESNEATQQ